MTPYTLDELVVLTGRAAQTRGRKVLLAAPDVADALLVAVPQAVPGGGLIPGPEVLDALLAVEVVVAEDAPPGTFRLVRHDACRAVETGSGWDVVHGGCAVIADGVIRSREEEA